MRVEASKRAVRVYILFFLAAIAVWLYYSNLDFYYGRGGNFPSFLANWPVSSRLLLLGLTSNAFYVIIALGLIIAFFNPKIEIQRQKNKVLAGLGILLIVNALVVGWNNGFLKGDLYSLMDTIIYGFGFGLMFLLMSPQKTLGMCIILWTRLIEVGGFAVGYFFIPGVLSMWPEGYALGHLVHGPAFMFTNYFFLTDNITAIGSLLGVVILLRKFNFSRFWITAFFIGAIFVGYNIARYLITNF